MAAYDPDWMRDNRDALRAEDADALDRFNACHRLTAVERERAMAWAAQRPELIRYPVKREMETWPLASLTTTSAASPATTSTRVPVSTTRRPSSSGYSSRSRRGSASASSRGRSSSSAPKSGARLLVDGGAWLLMFAILAGWYLAIRAVGGA